MYQITLLILLIMAATTSLLYDPNKPKFIKKIVDYISDFACKPLHANNKIYKSDFSHSDNNLLSSYNRFYGDIKTSVNVYTKHCFITSKNLVKILVCNKRM